LNALIPKSAATSELAAVVGFSPLEVEARKLDGGALAGADSKADVNQKNVQWTAE
jgi:hypothetical protein